MSKKWLRILGGLLLVGALWWSLDVAAILTTLKSVDPVLWGQSVGTAVLASLACAWWNAAPVWCL